MHDKIKKLILTIYHMRMLQRTYFLTRNQVVLKKCKIYEKEIDLQIKFFIDESVIQDDDIEIALERQIKSLQ